MGEACRISGHPHSSPGAAETHLCRSSSCCSATFDRSSSCSLTDRTACECECQSMNETESVRGWLLKLPSTRTWSSRSSRCPSLVTWTFILRVATAIASSALVAATAIASACSLSEWACLEAMLYRSVAWRCSRRVCIVARSWTWSASILRTVSSSSSFVWIRYRGKGKESRVITARVCSLRSQAYLHLPFGRLMLCFQVRRDPSR